MATPAIVQNRPPAGASRRLSLESSGVAGAAVPDARLRWGAAVLGSVMPFRILSALAVMAMLAFALGFGAADRSPVSPAACYLAAAFTLLAQFYPVVSLPAGLLGVACIGGAIWVQPNLMVWFYPGDGLYQASTGREALGLILVGVWCLVLYGRGRRGGSDGEVLAGG